MKARRAAFVLAFYAFGAMAGAPSARADEPGADAAAGQFFRAGLAAYERHEYRAAALAFEEAHRRLPRGAAIYNAGRSWEEAGDPVRAADAFVAAIASGELDAHDAQVARAHLARLAPSLGTVDLLGPAEVRVTVDGADRGPLPLAFHLAPGPHEVRATRSDGSVAPYVVSVGAGESSSLSIEDAPRPPPPPAPLSTPAPPLPLPEPGYVAGQPEARSFHRELPPWGWVAVSTSAVLAATGLALYTQFLQDRSTYDANLYADRALHDRADGERTAMFLLWGGAAASALAAAYGYLTSQVPSRSAALVGLGLGPGWVSAGARF